MAWQQSRQPNLNPYIIQPDGHGGTYTLTSWLGWCLAYVQTAFGTGWGGTTAWDCWENHTVNKHADWNLPGGVYIPIFFSGAAGDGHTAIYKDGHIWSAPLEAKPYADEWDSIQQVETKYGVSYVGWAEGLGGTAVIQNTPDVTPAPPYTVTETYSPNKLVKTNKQPTYKWGMSYDNFTAMNANPITTVDIGTILTIGDKVHHVDGYDYYRQVGDGDGWNVADCDDYTSPPPAPPVPIVLAQKYTVHTTVMYFGSSSDAQFKNNALGTINAGDYYQFASSDATVQLGTDNMHPLYWINIKDNIAPTTAIKPSKPAAPPEPVYKPSEVPIGTEADTTWKATYKSFHTDRHADTYQLTMPYTMKEYGGKRKPVALNANAKINIVGTFTKNGVLFYRPRANNDEYFSWYYGIPQKDDDGNAVLVKITTELDLAEKHISDFFHYWRSDLKEIWDVFVLRKNKKE